MPSPSPEQHATLRRSGLLAGRYHVLRKLGSGSAGTVYLTFDEKTRHEVALKLLRTGQRSAAAVATLQGEFRAFASVRHPRIARAFDFGYLDAGRVPYYTREHIAGSPLPPGPPAGESPADFLRPILDLLDALCYLHSSGILHLDVHAGNLIVSNDASRGSVLIDFGLPGSLTGTPAAISDPQARLAAPPEVLHAGKAGPSSDLYMAGRLLLYRLTGRTDGDPSLPAEIPGWGPRLTLDLERIAAKALQASPAQRFASAVELRAALASALGEASSAVARHAPVETTVGRSAELQQIEESLRAFAAGASSTLVFGGPGGSGKSRLLTEARLRAQLRGHEVVEVRFASSDDSAAALAAAVRACRSLPAADLRWLQPLQAELGGTPGERAARAAKAYSSGPGRPLVLVLDDLDAADEESLLLAGALIREAAAAGGKPPRPVCIYGTVDDAEGGHWQRLLRPALGKRLRRLKPLSRREASDLLASLLRPLTLPRRHLSRVLARSGRLPLRLRRIAQVLAEEWGPLGALPASAEIPERVLEGAVSSLPPWAAADPQTLALLRCLAILGRGATREEIAAGAAHPPGVTDRILRRCVRAELVVAEGSGRRRVCRVHGRPLRERLLEGLRSDDVRAVHARLADFWQHAPRRSPADEAHLARHLLLAGRARQGRELALRTAQALRARGDLSQAVDLLRAALDHETSAPLRLDLAERLSSVLEELGSHEEGIRLLEPYRRAASAPARRRRVRILRLLGVHYHRAGRAEEALAAFEECRRAADTVRDREDLAFVDSELAELHIYRSRYAGAEEACRRGLERVRQPGVLPGFRADMEVVLRASLGHLELRRMDLPAARRELRAALQAGRGGIKPMLASAILNNLGIAERQLSRFAASRACFRRAEKLLRRAGEGRALIKIACNLALIAAHTGDAVEAHREMERAVELLRLFPGQRLDFFVGYTRGIVAQALGDLAGAIEQLERSLPLGRKLGDDHLVRFGEVVLAEAHMACGRHGQALALLRGAARAARARGPALLGRMTAARLLLLAAVLADRGLRAAALRLLEGAPRTSLELPEAWNDLFLGLAALAAGEPAAAKLDEALARFEALQVPAESRLARAAVLAAALRDGTAQSILPLAPAGASAVPGPAHPLLTALEPLLVAEASFAAGDLEAADVWVARASAALVGLSCLELDWRLELLRARIALRRGDRGGARRHIERSLQTRALLLELVPRSSRRSFASHPRFRVLEDAAARVQTAPHVISSTDKLRRAEPYEGMVGQSSSMVRVFQTIEQLSDLEVPVVIRGETGTGKELVARALHHRSSRGGGPFLALHCASLPQELFEAELFGHEAGAFTGAEGERKGILEELAGGTLLLDDVFHLPLAAQAKLVHALGTRRVRRLGGLSQRPIDVRLLASTNVDLAAAVERGVFRADLLFRLQAVEIVVPPLRERRVDISLLARHLLEQLARRLDRPCPVLEPAALELLEGQPWPGNVRELEAVLLRALLHASPGAALRAADLQAALPPPAAAPRIPDEILRGKSLKELRLEVERAYLVRAFREARGDAGRVMADLGVRRTQLYALLRKVGLDMRELRVAPGGKRPGGPPG